MVITRTDSNSSTVLVIENDPLMLTAIGSVLQKNGHRAVLARTIEVAQQPIPQGQPDVIVLSIDDLRTGCQLANSLRQSETTRDVPILFLVPEQTQEWMAQLANQGGLFSMLKPIDTAALLELIDKAVWLHHIARGRLGGTKSHINQNDWITLD